MPDPRRSGAYTASDNALRGRGSGHTRLCQTQPVAINVWSKLLLSYLTGQLQIIYYTQEHMYVTMIVAIVINESVQSGFSGQTTFFIKSYCECISLVCLGKQVSCRQISPTHTVTLQQHTNCKEVPHMWVHVKEGKLHYLTEPIISLRIIKLVWIWLSHSTNIPP